MKGWTDAFAVDMNQFYRNSLSTQEHTRVEHLEPFDEYEEFSLKCSHYFLCVATKGRCCEMSKNMTIDSKDTVTEATNENHENDTVTDTTNENDELSQIQSSEAPISFTSLTKLTELDKTNPYQRSNGHDSNSASVNTVDSIQVFGHAVCRLGSHTAVVTGGFGEVKKKHSRWQNIVMYDLSSGTMEIVSPHVKASDTETANSKGKKISRGADNTVN